MEWLDVRIVGEEFTSENGKSTGTIVYHATADGFAWAADALSADDGTVAIPEEGDSFDEDRPWIRVIRRTVKRVLGNSPNKFEITVTTSDPTGGDLPPGGVEEDLLSKAATWTESDEEVMEPYEIDEDDEQVVNAAGERFDQMPERPSGVTVYTIGKYVTADQRLAIKAAKRTTNNAALTVLGEARGIDTLYLANASFELVVNIYKATLTMKYKPGGWKDKILNVGFSEMIEYTFDQDDGRGPVTEYFRFAIMEVAERKSDGTPKRLAPVARPYPLNADGTKRSAPDDFGDPLEFRPFDSATWDWTTGF